MLGEKGDVRMLGEKGDAMMLGEKRGEMVAGEEQVKHQRKRNAILLGGVHLSEGMRILPVKEERIVLQAEGWGKIAGGLEMTRLIVVVHHQEKNMILREG